MPWPEVKPKALLEFTFSKIRDSRVAPLFSPDSLTWISNKTARSLIKMSNPQSCLALVIRTILPWLIWRLHAIVAVKLLKKLNQHKAFGPNEIHACLLKKLGSFGIWCQTNSLLCLHSWFWSLSNSASHWERKFWKGEKSFTMSPVLHI